MKKIVLSVIMSLLILPGCGSMKHMSPEERAGVGAQIGSFIGWLFGGAVGYAINDERGVDLGSFIGTAVGGVAGASIAATTSEEAQKEREEDWNRMDVYIDKPDPSLPDLQIEDILLDEDSVSRNQKIDAGETCRLTFVIVNNGYSDALQIEPVVIVEKGKSKIKVSEPTLIERISHDDRITYTVTLQASPKLRSGKALFSIRLNDNEGIALQEKFTVETQGKS